MSDGERSGRRDLLYSRWHRKDSFKRYMTTAEAVLVEMVDIDSCESCPYCHHPLALIETKNSSRSPSAFPTRNTANLARQAHIPAFCVTYTCVCGITGEGHVTTGSCDIAHLQRQRIEPADTEITQHDPRDYALWLLALRSTCGCRIWEVA